MRNLLHSILPIVVILVLSCSPKPTYHSDPIPEHTTHTVISKFVNESRVINVWTPPQYKSTLDSFPVLYMPDGGIKEDFPHIANTLSKLIDSNDIPPFILVGIENTERGRDLTGPSEVADDAQYCPLTDGAKEFRAFITEELVQKIEQEYRTTGYKGIIGESLAGLFVMETFLTQSEAFDFYIAMDPSLWWNAGHLTEHAKSYLNALTSKPTKVWFAGSSAQDISLYTNGLAKKIEEKSPSNLTWKYSDEPNEKHNTIFRATKEKAMKWAMN